MNIAMDHRWGEQVVSRGSGAGRAPQPWIKRLFTGSFWANTPIPEGFVVGLLLGGGLQALAPSAISRDSRSLRFAGLALVPAGLGLVAWAMAAASEINIDRPTELVTRGPYAISRNPMYLGWALASLGTSLLANSRWLLASTGAAGLFLHLHDIPREEESLLARFGKEYVAYRWRDPPLSVGIVEILRGSAPRVDRAGVVILSAAKKRAQPRRENHSLRSSE